MRVMNQVKFGNFGGFMSGTRLIGACLALFLTGCSSIADDPGEMKRGGYVAGDEPNAVRAGAAVLAEGGSAADAATAIYFALSATYPVAAGLGGGGLCLVHNGTLASSEAFIFLPRKPASNGLFSLPGNVAGFAALQGAYGRLPWQRDLVRAEELAAAGFPISEMLAQRLAASQDAIRLDAALATEFLDESGYPKPAGSRVDSPELGRTLSLIRERGAAGFYRGEIAAEISAYSAAQGGAISADELAGYLPSRGAADSVQLKNVSVDLPPRQANAGTFLPAALANVPAAEDPNGAIAHITTRTLGELNVGAVPRDLGSTGFVAVDASGQAIACSVTMDGPFGSGHTAQGTGVTLGRAPPAPEAGLAQLFLSTVIARTGMTPILAGAGAGGPGSGAVLAYLLVKRAASDNAQVTVPTTGATPFDAVNVIGCGNGGCAAVADPGGHGLGMVAGK